MFQNNLRIHHVLAYMTKAPAGTMLAGAFASLDLVGPNVRRIDHVGCIYSQCINV
jgi:hypothetical protein